MEYLDSEEERQTVTPAPGASYTDEAGTEYRYAMLQGSEDEGVPGYGGQRPADVGCGRSTATPRRLRTITMRRRNHTDDRIMYGGPGACQFPARFPAG